MIRPAIETVLSALLLSAFPYLRYFGHLTLGLGSDAEKYLSVIALLLGLWFAASVWSAYPTWQRGLLALTGALLACVGIMFAVVFSGPIIR